MINWNKFCKIREYKTEYGSTIFVVKHERCDYTFHVLAKINFDKKII